MVKENLKKNTKKAVIFDSGALISLSMNGLLDELQKLKGIFKGDFLITEQVKYEVIDKPINIKCFELEALKAQQLLDDKILEMAEEAKGMVKDAIDSFVNLNIEQAQKVLDRDDVVDKLNKTIFKFLVTKMQLDPSLIEPASQMIVLARNLERLADHATNIAEELVFYVKAEIIAHSRKHDKSKNDEEK